MIARDEDALVCDFAETYHCFDYRALPLRTAATLAVGLPDDSRIKRLMCGRRNYISTDLLAAAVDRLSFLVWAQTKDAQHGLNCPASIYEAINRTHDPAEDAVVFRSVEDFMAARAAYFTEVE